MIRKQRRKIEMNNIVMLHLSDLHITKESDTKVINVHKIVDVLNTVSDFSEVLIIVSGDIAYSGKREEYDAAYKMFGTIIKEIKDKFGKIDVNLMIVPGNHDVDLSVDMGAEAIEKIIKEGLVSKAIPSELEKQKNYINYAKGNRCIYIKSPLCCVKKRDINDTSIKLFLLNTAIFSTLDNDKNLHFMPDEVLEKIEDEQLADINIAVMHHSQHWFNERVKKRFEDTLIRNCQLVFCGHEHNIGTQVISQNGFKTVFLAGGELCNKGNWVNSAFYLDIYDTENKIITVNEYRWNAKRKIYEKKEQENYSLVNEERTTKFRYEEEFIDFLKTDEDNSICEDASEYFVFPTIEEVKSNAQTEAKTFGEQNEFIEEIVTEKRISIVGSQDAGKTRLMKQLLQAMNGTDKCCLYCDMSQMGDISSKKLIKTIFRNNYKDDEGDFDFFEQLPIAEKVIFLDNVHDMDKNQFVSLLKYLDSKFGIIVYGTKNIIELDPAERLKQNAELNQYNQYKILPFFSSKRVDLVRKIIDIKENGSKEDKDELCTKIAESLKMARKFYSMNPSFIIQYTIYYCNNFKNAQATDGDVFSKVFESNLILAIRPFVKGITVDKVFVLLDEVAYWCYKNKEGAIDQKEISDIIFSYNDKHGDDVDLTDFIRICVDAKILQKVQGGRYRFIDQNRLSYFIARQIIRLWNDNLDNSDFQELIKYVKYGNNSNIVLFVTYLTDNMFFVKDIIRKAFEYSKNWLVFDPGNITIPYLSEMNDELLLEAPTENERKQNEKKEQEEDKAEVLAFENSQIIVKDCFSYDTSDSEENMNQIIRSLSLLDIISKCLPGFEHRMEKEDKEKVLSLVMNLPGQIFYAWAISVEEEKEDLLDFLLEEYRNAYLNPEDWGLVKRQDMLRYLQAESISLLLELMNVAVNGSVKEHTIKYFNEERRVILLHKLEYLMALTKLDKVDDVINYMKELEEETKKLIPNYMKKRVLRNYMIKSKKITQPKLQQLHSKYFPTDPRRKDYQKLLISRERNKKKQ